MEEHRGLWAISKDIPKIKNEMRLMVPPLSYIDVRRHRLPIYDAISRELLEDGCTECVEHFERLSQMENYLFEMRIITTRILEAPGLLEAIIDNVRIAERNCKILHNRGLALRTLFQTAILLDRREGNEYNWLTKELYLIVNDFIDKWSKRWKFPETECRSRYYFGKFLILKDNNYVQAIEELKKALELAQCKQWYTAKDTYNYLSLKTRVYLCKAYLCEADRIQKKDKLLAEELATHALMAIWEDRAPKDVKLYCEACLKKGFYSIRLKLFDKTLLLYKKVQPYIYSLTLPEFKCEMLLHQGICHFNLGNDSLAIRKLKQSIRLGKIYNLKIFHAHALVQIGKLYSKSSSTYNLSQKSFHDAREIYTELNDDNNVKKVNYLAAKLKSLQILPNLVTLIITSADSFCDLLTLRAFKDELEVFWKDDEYKEENEIPDDTIFDEIEEENVEVKKDDTDKNEIVENLKESIELKKSKTDETETEVENDEIVEKALENIPLKQDESEEMPNNITELSKDEENELPTEEENEMSHENEMSKDEENEEMLYVEETENEPEDDDYLEEIEQEPEDDDQVPYKCIFKRMP